MKIQSTFTQYYYGNKFANKTDKSAVTPTFTSGKIKAANLIRGQENCWRLHQPKIYEQFIRADEQLKKIVEPVLKLCDSYRIPPSVNVFIKFKEKKEEITEFFEVLKSKYGINLEIPPTVYRFIGESEVKALQSGMKLQPQRDAMGRFDVTIDPELNWNEYRVTFKPDSKFSILDSMSLMRENPGVCHEYFYHLYG